MTEMHVTVSLHGPFFAGGRAAAIVEGIDEGLEQIALKGQSLVQAQLTPGHGVRTGHFRRSIHGGLQRHLHAQIDAGLAQQGANVVYTNWLETGTRRGVQTRFGGYAMFANAERQLQNLDLRSYIADRVVRRLT